MNGHGQAGPHLYIFFHPLVSVSAQIDSLRDAGLLYTAVCPHIKSPSAEKVSTRSNKNSDPAKKL